MCFECEYAVECVCQGVWVLAQCTCGVVSECSLAGDDPQSDDCQSPWPGDWTKEAWRSYLRAVHTCGLWQHLAVVLSTHTHLLC